MNALITDYSFYHRSSEDYACGNAIGLDELAATICEAYEQGIALRIRGKGHSMNGNSLPRRDERLLSSAHFNYFKFENEGTVTVGAGSAVWDVNTWLRRYGNELLVYNDGQAAASSVGGFISAGGIGESCYHYGGFWETVESISFINGKGELVKSNYGDDIFPWLFGSMGQLGFIYEVTLKIKPVNTGSIDYPFTQTGIVRASQHHWERIVWYNLFTPREFAEQAQKDLVFLSHVHTRTWATRPIYKYEIPFKTFNPPLVFPFQKDMIAMGIWGTPWNGESFDVKALKLLEQDFTEIINSNPQYRRYVQAEFLFEGFDYRAYFGEAIFGAFKKLKQQLDPKSLFGKGILDQ